MRFGKTILGLNLELKLKVNPKTDNEEHYKSAPLCKYNKGACICMRQLGKGPYKCYYKKGPEKCCFEKEETKEILEKSKSQL